MSNYTIRRLEPDHFDLLLPVMKDSFGLDVNIEYFKWKFLDNPAGHFVGFIAVEDQTNEVAAYYGVIPEKYSIDGNARTIYQSCDTMTHSRHRRKGLFQKLALHCYQYLKENDQLFVIGFGGGQSTPGFLKFGWTKIFDFQNLFIPKILCYTTVFSKYSQDLFTEVRDLTFIEGLIGKTQPTRIHSHRDLEHLAWRYRNPAKSYKMIAYTARGNVEGFICFYAQNNKIFLFDFVFDSQASRKGLINYLKNLTIESKSSAVVAFCQQNSYPDAELKKSGFLNNPFHRGPLNEKTPFIFYSDQETMSNFGDSSVWSIKSYDHDAM